MTPEMDRKNVGTDDQGKQIHAILKNDFTDKPDLRGCKVTKRASAFGEQICGKFGEKRSWKNDWSARVDEGEVFDVLSILQ